MIVFPIKNPKPQVKWLKDMRKQLTQNVFCPTGEGGGVDPTCKKDDAAKVHEEVSATFSEWAKELSSEEKETLHNYMASDSDWINGLLRGESVPDEAKTKRQIELIDTALAKAPPLSKDITVYRGLSAQHFGDLKVGDEFSDAGFGSFALNPNAAHNFSNYGWDEWGEGMEIELTLPAGEQVGAYLWGKELATDLAKAHSSDRGEREFLLPRNFAMTVTSVETKKGTLFVKAVPVGITANIFCATGKGGGVDPTCTKEGPDTGGGSGGGSYRQDLRGEYWLDSGQSMFADGDIGDMNHEGYAIDNAQREILSAMDGDEFSEGDGVDWDGFIAHLEEVHGDEDGYLAAMKEAGISDELYQTALGMGDVRQYAAEQWGWIRVHGNDVQMRDLSQLDDLASGLADAHQDDVDGQSFNIETKDAYYTDVPYQVIEGGKAADLREYKSHGLPGWGGTANAFCPTGPGGGVDPTCSPGNGFTRGVERLDLSGRFGSTKQLRVYRNPSFKQAQGMLEKFSSVRGLKAESGDFYLWDANKAIHETVATAIGGVSLAYMGETKQWDAENDADAHDMRRTLRSWKRDQVLNVFCPTGEGGGVDPSCSPGGRDPEKRVASIRPKELTARAIKKFGKTDDLAKAGYIMPNGDMLDLSDGNDIRHLDHRFVHQLYPRAWDQDDAMLDFMKQTGAMRMHYEDGDAPFFVHFNSRPTQQQLKVLGEAVDRGQQILYDLGADNTDVLNTDGYIDNKLHFGRFKLEAARKFARHLTDNRANGYVAHFATANAFCPTGDGGGQDNSCPPNRGHGFERIGGVKAYRNPSYRTARSWFLKSKAGLRFLRDPATNDIYIWDAMDAVHQNVFDSLGLEYDEKADMEGEMRWEVKRTDDHPNDDEFEDVWMQVDYLKQTHNVFCPTGKGGGVDPTCGKGGWSGLSEVMVKHQYALGEMSEVKVFGNPTGQQAMNWFKKYAGLRGITHKKGGLTLIWNPDASVHSDMFKATGLKSSDFYRWELDNLTFKPKEVEAIVTKIVRGKWTPEERKAFRNTILRNVFCPTGPGGGIDPTCSPGGVNSPAFKKWFGKSKVVDANDKPLKVYHGTTAEFDEFSYEKIGTHGTSEGRGFYFTDDPEVASGYGEGGHVKAVYVSIQKPLSTTSRNMKAKEVEAFIKKLDPDGTGYLSNWGDVESEGYQNVLKRASRSEMSGSDNDVDLVNGIIAADGGPSRRTFSALTDATGYDGIIEDSPTWGKQKIIIPFHPEQIKSATGNRGTFDPTSKDIRNQFCATGPGGGVDPTCSPDKGGGYGSGRQSSHIEEVAGKKVFVNPSKTQLANWVEEKYSSYGVRGLLDQNGDVYYWGASIITHSEMAGSLDMTPRASFLLEKGVDKKWQLFAWNLGEDAQMDDDGEWIDVSSGRRSGELKEMIDWIDRFKKQFTANVKTSGKFSSTQVNIDEPLKSLILDGARLLIPESELSDDGFEDMPHITVKYGLHTNDPDEVRRVIENFPPIKAKLGKLGIFNVKKPDGREFDVVKIDVHSDDLAKANKIISDSLEHTDTYAQYQPHVTLAYVKAGNGAKYAGIDIFDGYELIFDTISYSNKRQVHTPIDLTGSLAFNVFCPTGKGGGVDPTCTKDGAGAGGVHKTEWRQRADDDNEFIGDNFWGASEVYEKYGMQTISGLEGAEIEGLGDFAPELPEKLAAKAARAASRELSYLKSFPAVDALMQRGEKQFAFESEEAPTKIRFVSYNEIANYVANASTNVPNTAKIEGCYDRRNGDILIVGEQDIFPDPPKPNYGGFTLGKDLASTIRHEYGHKVFNEIAGVRDRWYAQGGAGELLEKPEDARKVSLYGASDAEELFAESFAAYTHPEYRSGELPPGIETFLDQLVYDETVDEPKSTRNIFCATGEGGGVDPTCTKDNAGSGQKQMWPLEQDSEYLLAKKILSDADDEMEELRKLWGFKNNPESASIVDDSKEEILERATEVLQERWKMQQKIDQMERPTSHTLKQQWEQTKPKIDKIVKEQRGGQILVDRDSFESLDDPVKDAAKESWKEDQAQTVWEESDEYAELVANLDSSVREDLDSDETWAHQMALKIAGPLGLSTDDLDYHNYGDRLVLKKDSVLFEGENEADPDDAVRKKEIENVAKEFEEQFQYAYQQELQSRLDDASNMVSNDEAIKEETINDAWDNLSNSEKMGYVSGEHAQPTRMHPPESYDPLGELNSPYDYEKTRSVARYVQQQRTRELLDERKIFPTMTDRNEIVRMVESMTWEDWKTSSTSPFGKALQLACVDELKTFGRPDLELERNKIISNIGYENFEAMKAHVRATWESSQYVLEQAGVEEVDSWRAVFVDDGKLKNTDKITYDWPPPRPGNARYFTKLPSIELLRNGAQSATVDHWTANSWQGVGNVTGTERVVLRIASDPTSVLSLPVHGQNLQSEKEVVLTGNGWRSWDAWYNVAPYSQLIQNTIRICIMAKQKQNPAKLQLDLTDGGQWLGVKAKPKKKYAKVIDKILERVKEKRKKDNNV